MSFMIPAGLAILAYTWFNHRKLVRVEWNSVASFLGFMALATIQRIGLYDFLADVDPRGFHYPPISPQFLGKPIWRFCLVFWEDAFFGIPIYMAFKRCRKWLAWVFVISLSMLFGQAHGYQGDLAIIVTAIYPYFISYRMGSKYGFGTVMVSHMLYDIITFYTIWFLPYLI